MNHVTEANLLSDFFVTPIENWQKSLPFQPRHLYFRSDQKLQNFKILKNVKSDQKLQ
jgi:hypothetical protein